MIFISKKDYMKNLGTSEAEQNSLKELDFYTFINLKVGDTVYLVNDYEYFIKVPYVVVYSKWLKSPDGVYNRKFKSFYYKQICFVRGFDKRYSDSAGHNYKRLYVKNSLYKELLSREINRKNKK